MIEPPLSILVMDDDALSVRLLSAMLSKAGHAVRAAANGKEGMDIILETNPDLIITDWMMPEMDGPAFLKVLRSSKTGRSKYVIVLTSKDDEETLVEAFEAGADDYILKPVSPRALEARVRAGQRVFRLQQAVEREMEEARSYVAELAVANRRWEEAAFTDALTGLPNRRYAMERLKQERSAALRNDHPLSCLLVDVDHFKQVNDSYGHDVGDAVLQTVAKVLRSSMRTEDVVCRIGGEEFLVICPDTSGPKAAESCGERIRKVVESQAMEAGGFNGRVTVSIGVAGRTPSHPGVDALLKSADVAVYDAKRGGRNRVCLAA
jgi:diguanylate cyclase (GGDEF)-like protein